MVMYSHAICVYTLYILLFSPYLLSLSREQQQVTVWDLSVEEDTDALASLQKAGEATFEFPAQLLFIHQVTGVNGLFPALVGAGSLVVECCCWCVRLIFIFGTDK